MIVTVASAGTVVPGRDPFGGPLTCHDLPAAGSGTAPAGAGLPQPEPGPDWFDAAALLGRRGWRYLSPATRYLLAAGRLAAPWVVSPPADPGLAVAVGTHHAIAAMHRDLATTLATEGVAGFSPASLPGFSVNIPASQLAIDRGAAGFSVTVTDPTVAGLEAVVLAARALARGRAERALAGATDEHVPGQSLPGAAVLELRAGAAPSGPALTGALSGFVGVPPDRSAPAESALARCGHRLAELLARGRDADPTGPVRLHAVLPPGVLGDAVHDRLRTLARAAGSLEPHTSTAQTGSVLPVLQLVDALRRSGPSLVVALSPQGHLAAVAVRGANPLIPSPRARGASTGRDLTASSRKETP